MDECAICGLTKVEHDDPAIHHRFSQHGELNQKDEARVARPVQVSPGDVVIRLITVLRAREVLNKDDLDIIFGGTDAPARGGSLPEDRGTGSTASSS